MTIQRVYAFNVPNEEDIPGMVQAYRDLAEENQKVCHTTSPSSFPQMLTQLQDGEKYILDIKAFKQDGDKFNQNYNFVAMTQFKDAEDMKFYDNECPAHQKLKDVGKGKTGPPLILFGNP